MNSAQLSCTLHIDCYESSKETCPLLQHVCPPSQDNMCEQLGQVCLAGIACPPLLPLTRPHAKGLLMQNSSSPTTQAHIERTPAMRVCTLLCTPVPLNYHCSPSA